MFMLDYYHTIEEQYAPETAFHMNHIFVFV